mmetsp:Transcript_25500/g.55469  ORF Transcript_25500/g.55469 Transcript_25500/m.55469 type:complete len:504 (+) Transcript_25500:62-1573(+)|eukprot:CAMPEP_0202890892 /NCGR_PEP_ID=MMETSP1392-20130828/1154_1 /ASSEMBLY_ACC=CAM_ASM_000868 /TAXON_ID=225041 /ORGANISM="Chlamydomonas chlamydogama, Strain SAG 11-48b" /LENGTH=503 /DNA_ID=CAMNT_0049574543 /DNA_START=62 /DNA_END=1573 /DNA_ORIENTATION=+
MPRKGCGVCETLANRSFVCPNCLNSNVLSDRRQHLQLLQKKRDALLNRLNELFERKKVQREQELERQRLNADVENEAMKALAAQKELKRVKEEVAKLRQSNLSRRTHNEKTQAQLVSTRADMLSNHFPTLLRYQSLTYSHVSAMLLREQKLKLKQLLDILPLRITGLKSGGGSAIQISICGLKVPDSVLAPLTGWQQPEGVSASLGYTLLFLDLMANYMGGPLLHEGSFQGSTTVLWQQQSFWNRRPLSTSAVLPLYLEDSAPGGTIMPSMSSKKSSSPWAALPLARGLSSGEKSMLSRGGSSAADVNPEKQKQNADLFRAFDMLQRSISCFVRDKAVPFNIALPPTWSPVGWLVMLCATLKKDARTEGVLSAASCLTEEGGSGAGPTILWDDVALTGEGNDSGPDAIGSPGGYPGEEEEDVDGWDMVHVPLLPPRPSEPEAVLELWSKTMLRTPSAAQAAVRTVQSVGQALNGAGLAAGTAQLLRMATGSGSSGDMGLLGGR